MQCNKEDCKFYAEWLSFLNNYSNTNNIRFVVDEIEKKYFQITFVLNLFTYLIINLQHHNNKQFDYVVHKYGDHFVMKFFIVHLSSGALSPQTEFSSDQTASFSLQTDEV